MKMVQNKSILLCVIFSQLTIFALCQTTSSDNVTTAGETTTQQSEADDEGGESEFPLWAWAIIAVAGFVVVVLLISILIFVSRPSSPQPSPSKGARNKLAPRPFFGKRHPVVPIAAPPAPVFLPTAPQQAPQKAVLTPYGPVPLITSMPVMRRVPSQPIARRPVAYGTGSVRSAMAPVIHYPEYDATLERDAYSDIEEVLPFDDEIASVHGSERIYGGSMRSRGTFGGRNRSRSRRSHVGLDDIYGRIGPPGSYTVIEERIPRSQLSRAYSVVDY